MRNTLRTLSALTFFVALLTSSVALAKDNWVGTWKLNVAASKFSPGHELKSETLKFEASKGAIKLTSNSVDAKGKAMTGTYTSKFDGKDVPWKGNPDADMASPKRIDDNSYENTWKKGGVVTISAKVSVSADGKTLTISQSGKNAKGEAVENALVFDKQ